MKKLLVLILMFSSSFVCAAIEPSAPSKVTRIVSYAEYSDGDVVVKLENHSTNCDAGYWLKKADAGFQVNVSMLIAAYQAKNKVILHGHTDQLWSGSTGKYCHVYAIDYL